MRVTIDGIEYERVDRDKVMLSVLVPSVSTRRATFAPKMAEMLFGQHERLKPELRKRVEILMLTDAKGMLVGDKRNAMVRMARGEYVVFVDDDDRVTDDYLASLLAATDAGSDCITFDASVSLNGAPPKPCRYSLQYQKDANAADHYQRLPNHITAVRRALALACPFPSKQCGEDSDYAVRLRPALRTEHRIERVLYHYDYSDATTETQRTREQPAAVTAVVDVVILSKATTPQLKTMCQTAINTCIAGAGPRVRVLVIEQAPGIHYEGATVIYDPSEFNYNKFANRGAAHGHAPWIMVANSDLEFQAGWLDGLLAAGNDCVSPVDPNSKKQNTVVKDEMGFQNGYHFSGWCFMVKRELWERWGGFDDCVKYWCSDDVVIEQCRGVGVTPMVVAAAKVKHLGSKTMPSAPDDFTWGQVFIFNRKYHQDRFVNDPRYQAYVKRAAQ